MASRAPGDEGRSCCCHPFQVHYYSLLFLLFLNFAQLESVLLTYNKSECMAKEHLGSGSAKDTHIIPKETKLR